MRIKMAAVPKGLPAGDYWYSLDFDQMVWYRCIDGVPCPSKWPPYSHVPDEVWEDLL